MKPPKSAGLMKWQAGALLSAGLFGLSASLLAAPPRASKAASKAPTGAEAKPQAAVPAAASSSTRDFADAWPSSTPGAADLQLQKDAERKAEALVAFARGLVSEDGADMEAALASYRRALELDPSYVELAVKVAFELARRNNPSEGIQVLKDAAKAAPRAPLPLIYLSQLYAKHLSKPDLALKYAEQALALDPQNFLGYKAVFELHIAAGDTAKAQQLLARAGKAASTDPKFWLQLGELHTHIHLNEDGTADSPEALKQMNAIFRKAAELAGEDALVAAHVGDFLVLSRQVKEAIPFYLKALTLKPRSSEPPLANVREKLARALLATGQRGEAIGILEEITKQQPLHFAIYELLGALHEAEGNVDKALANYEHSVLLDASKPDNHIRVAELKMRLKRYDAAVETAQSARARFPDQPETLYLLAIALSQAKRHTEAMTAFAEAQAVFEARHEDLLNAQFYFSYGAAAEQAGLIDRAAELLKRSIELDPANAAQAYNYIGYMWVDRGENLDEAGAYIKKALEMDPDNGAFLDSAGWFHFKKGNYEKALAELLKAAEHIKPEDAVVYDHIGDTYQKLSQPAEALRYWQKALALDEGNAKIAEKVEAAKQKVSANTQAAKPSDNRTPAP